MAPASSVARRSGAAARSGRIRSAAARSRSSASRLCPSAPSWRTAGRSCPAARHASTRRWAHSGSEGSSPRPRCSAIHAAGQGQIALRRRWNRPEVVTPDPETQRFAPVGQVRGQVVGGEHTPHPPRGGPVRTPLGSARPDRGGRWPAGPGRPPAAAPGPRAVAVHPGTAPRYRAPRRSGDWTGPAGGRPRTPLRPARWPVRGRGRAAGVRTDHGAPATRRRRRAR